MILKHYTQSYSEDNSIIFVKETDNSRIIQYQYCVAKIVSLQPLPPLRNEQKLSNAFTEKFHRDLRLARENNKEQSLLLTNREMMTYFSDVHIDPYLIRYNQILNYLQFMKKQLVDLQIEILSDNSKENTISFAIAAFFYSSVKSETHASKSNLVKSVFKRLKNSSNDLPTGFSLGIKNNNLDFYILSDRLLLKKTSFPSDAIFTLRKSLFDKLMHHLGSDNHTNFKISEGSGIPLFTYNLQTQSLPKRLYCSASSFDSIARLIQTIGEKRIIKIGGNRPEGFDNILDLDLKLNFLEIMEWGPRAFVPMLSLIEELYNIWNFAHSFEMFYELYTDSLSKEQSDQLTIKNISKILKEVPLSSFEIPISNQTKTILNSFFLKFHYPEMISNSLDNQFPKHLHIPTTKGMEEDSLILLLLVIFNAEFDMSNYEVIIIDDQVIQKKLNTDTIIPHIQKIRDLYHIYLEINPYRGVLKHLPKLFLNPSSLVQQFIRDTFDNMNVDSTRDYYSQDLTGLYEVELIQPIGANNEIEEDAKDFEEFEIKEKKTEDQLIQNNSTYQQEQEVIKTPKKVDKRIGSQKPIQNPNYTKNMNESDDIDNFVDKLVGEANTQVMSMKHDKAANESDQKLPQKNTTEENTNSNKETSAITSKEANKKGNISYQPETSLIKTAKEMIADTGKKVNTGTPPINLEIPKPNQTNMQKSEVDLEPDYIKVFEHHFEIRSRIGNKNLRDVPSDTIINILEQGTYNFSVLTRLINSTTTKIHQDTLDHLELKQLEFLNTKQLIQLESTGHFYITSKGKEMISELISGIRNIPIKEETIKLLISKNNKLLANQQNYGKQTYVHTRMKVAIILGIQYYNQFKIMPPLILSIVNLYDKLKLFRMKDPDEFISLFDAKFVSILEDYRSDIKEDISRIKETYIDVEDAPVPRPFNETKTVISKDQENYDLKEFKDNTIISDGQSKYSKKQKVIVPEGNKSLDTNDADKPEDIPLPKIRTKPKKKKEEDVQKVITDTDLDRYEPEPLPPLTLKGVIKKLENEYLEDIRSRPERLQFTINSSLEAIPVIYDVTSKEVSEFDQLYEMDAYSLNLPTRIKNIIFKKPFSQEISISEFRTTQYTIEIPGIGPSSMKKIKHYQQLLSSELRAQDFMYLLQPQYWENIILSNVQLDIKLLPPDTFFQLTQIQPLELNQDETSIEELTTSFIKYLLKSVDEEYSIKEDVELSQLITNLQDFQKSRYPLLIDLSKSENDKPQFMLRFDTIYQLIDKYQNSDDKKTEINSYCTQLIEIYNQIYVNSSIFH